MRTKRMFALLACAGALTGVAASGASAGEVNPPHGYIAGSDNAPLNGKSDCAFSGLNDNYVFGTAGPGNPDSDGFTRTQSYGQAVKNGAKDFVPSPGVACNPSGH
jgi:hypothetical protein